jgi:hypothetical protein
MLYSHVAQIDVENQTLLFADVCDDQLRAADGLSLDGYSMGCR